MTLTLLWLLLVTKVSLGHVYNAVETEMFAIPISPNLFNWTYQGESILFIVLFLTNYYLLGSVDLIFSFLTDFKKVNMIGRIFTYTKLAFKYKNKRFSVFLVLWGMPYAPSITSEVVGSSMIYLLNVCLSEIDLSYCVL